MELHNSKKYVDRDNKWWSTQRSLLNKQFVTIVGKIARCDFATYFLSPFFPMKTRKAFTLIELLLVIGIIAILASIVIVAINPTKQLGDARDAQRRSDVNTILNAVYQYAIDNQGTLPGNIPLGTAKDICITSVKGATCTDAGMVDLATDLEGTYLVGIPEDPRSASGSSTEYTIMQDANGRITVTALFPEQAASISVTR